MITLLSVVFACFAVAFVLQGCGDGLKPRTTTTTTTMINFGWNMNPIEVRGQHLFDSVTGAQFRSVGVAFPGLNSDSVSEWVKVLRRISSLSPQVNTVRLSTLPDCALESECFLPFMQAADKLGIYVLVPGTGTPSTWGFLSTDPANFSQSASKCYKNGNVLAYGQSIVQRFNFPNTLAIVIGDEFVKNHTMWPYIAVLKAYARDLKSYMHMCNSNRESPTYSIMRQLPLMFASSDDLGDIGVKTKAAYLFCESNAVSIDIFGLNVERWRSDSTGPTAYNDINDLVTKARFPGAFMFSAMGSNKDAYGTDIRTWAQVPGFFQNFPSIDGFVGYDYYGKQGFNMFANRTSDAELLQDGKNFFGGLDKLGAEPHVKPVPAIVTACPASLFGTQIATLDQVPWYDTGYISWAPQCPRPPLPYDTTTTTTTTYPWAPPGPVPGWNLNPIAVRGQHLYDSVTGKQFHGRGIAFPDVQSEDASEWVKVLKRIKELSPHINLVRIYRPPDCALSSDCFAPFMQAADQMGVYVVVPGTGIAWGYLPTEPADFGGDDATADKCYKKGNVLGFGQSIVQRFNYPNTLAIVIGNEFVQKHHMWPFISVLKAYVRDLKSYMAMCDSDAESPTKGAMRQIPLMFASSDDLGDPAVKQKADYMFCNDTSVSVDIFGLNVERWCNDEFGPNAYKGISDWVGDKAYPGAFMFSEMGCSKFPYKGTRSWAQLENFFTRFPSVDSFVGYAYYGNKNFNMVAGRGVNDEVLQDGKNFFDGLDKLGVEPTVESVPPVRRTCATTFFGKDIWGLDTVHWYDTGRTSWPAQCPQPPQPYSTLLTV